MIDRDTGPWAKGFTRSVSIQAEQAVGHRQYALKILDGEIDQLERIQEAD